MAFRAFPTPKRDPKRRPRPRSQVPQSSPDMKTGNFRVPRRGRRGSRRSPPPAARLRSPRVCSARAPGLQNVGKWMKKATKSLRNASKPVAFQGFFNDFLWFCNDFLCFFIDLHGFHGFFYHVQLMFIGLRPILSPYAHLTSWAPRAFRSSSSIFTSLASESACSARSCRSRGATAATKARFCRSSAGHRDGRSNDRP